MRKQITQFICITTAALILAACGAAPNKHEEQERSAAELYSTHPPRMRPTSRLREYYPPAAKRAGRVGCVELSYSVNAEGKAHNIMVLVSDYDDFAVSAKAMLSSLRFDVPSDWSESGNTFRTYRIGFIFKIAGRQKPANFDKDIDQIEITAI